ncbi:MAG: ABC transporter substrate-binding protein [Candidatus Limnocylindrales bacterium]
MSAPRRPRSAAHLRLAAVAMVAVCTFAAAACGATRAATSGGTVRILGDAPVTWDPALQGDESTASVLANVDESLTAIDAAGAVQPALAASWTVSADSRSITFTLRPGLTFSDGTPLQAGDVVRSWDRLIDPRQPSPLAYLMVPIVGVSDELAGHGPLDAVGIRASGPLDVTVTFTAAAAYFPATAASPSLAVVPPSLDTAYAAATPPTSFVASGAYLPTAETASDIIFTANPRYWAGPPAIGTIDLVTDTLGHETYDAFEGGTVDYAPVAADAASWIRYDATDGPQLVAVPEPSVLFYGFDTRRAPFDDVRVRQAFAQAVDWHRLVQLGSQFDPVATSLVPPDIPGRPTGDYSPAYDPAAARAALAAAGYANGVGFPVVTLDSGGLPYDEALAETWHQVLGVTVDVEERIDGYFDLLATDPPQIFALDWVADYPAPQDFLGLLLMSGSSNDDGGWSDPSFDAAVTAGAASTDVASQVQHFDAAQRIVQAQVPVVPLSYGQGWALVRAGLRGAAASSLGILRWAGLAWGT